MAEQNNSNRPSQSSVRQVYVNFRFGEEPLFNNLRPNLKVAVFSLFDINCGYFSFLTVPYGHKNAI